MATIDRQTRLGFRDVVDSPEELASLYGPPSDAVVSKVIDRLDGHCRDFIARSPFVLLATTGPDGRCDVSPKGGDAGFVSVLDDQRLAIPDAPGNKLVFSLQNIEATGQAGLLFLIPGMEETLARARRQGPGRRRRGRGRGGVPPLREGVQALGPLAA